MTMIKHTLRHAVTAACLLGLLAVALYLLLALMAPASQAVGRRHLTPCEYEDSVSCVWDARHMGNGTGASFIVDAHGHVTYVSHKRAHRLAHQG